MKKLSIPEHIALGQEFLPGIGARELRQFLLAAVPGLLISVAVWIISGRPGPQLISMACGIGYLACCYAMFVKIDGSQSMYTFIARVMRFHRTQKNYYYIRGKEAMRYVGEEKRP